ncbi:MAG: iron ABC transporter permease [Pseudomonadota bacterium]
MGSLWRPIIGSAAIVCAAILCALLIGETRIPPDVALKVLANKLLGAGYDVNAIDSGILWSYRLTRAIVAACCGAGLAISGVVLQALLCNALAEPYLLGISAGASTGAVLATVAGFGGGAVSLSAGAFGGALAAFAIVVSLAHFAGCATARKGSVQIVLAGSLLFNALTSFIIARSANSDQARGIMFWLVGNMSGVRWEDVAVAVVIVIIGFIVIAWHARPLDAFTFGTDAAASVGVPVRRVQTVLILTTALLTAAMVSIVGAIGFVGLVIPHMARFIVGHSHAKLIPAAAVFGAVFLIFADITSRIIIPGQVLPIGVITALIGAPVFAAILIRGQRT